MSRWRTLGKSALWRARAYQALVRCWPWAGVMVLVYHGVRDAPATRAGTSEELHVRHRTLEEHLQVIRALATPISLRDWLRARRGGPLPPRAVLLTFDDGYRSFLTYALPLLERYDIPAVLFACTGPAQRRELLWYDALERLGRWPEVEPAKSLNYDDWRALVDSCRLAASRRDDRAVMTPEEIAMLAGHPLVDIGAHTVDHPILARAPAAVQRWQIGTSVRDLEAWTGRRICAFAYPNGRPGMDFTDETVAIVREVGIEWAFCTKARMAGANDARDSLPRFTMTDSISAAQLAQCLAVRWRRRA